MGNGAGAIGRTCATELRVRYAETDAMSVVYYANYFVWFEVGRGEWIRQFGLTYREFEEQGVYLPVVRAACDYKASARYDDLIRLETTVTNLTPVRIAFAYRVTRLDAAPGQATPPPPAVLAEGRTEHAFVGADGRLTRLDRHQLWQVLSNE